MRIAQVAPLFESVPPKLYGGTERVVYWLTEELVKQGHDVTLFASGDSVTSARLISCSKRSLRLDNAVVDELAHVTLQMERVFKMSGDFDLVHWHVDYMSYSLSRRMLTPHVTTLHGRLDLPDLVPLYAEFWDIPVISISDGQRQPFPDINWQGTVHHGLPEDLFEFQPQAGKYLAFLGRISPEKGPDRAIEIARRAGMPLKIAAKVSKPDREYYENVIKPLIDPGFVEFIGEINQAEKNEFLGNAYATLFTIDWPEPFGIVMIESMACGTPLIAFPRGSVPEVMKDGVTGWVVPDITSAVMAVERLGSFDRGACRAHFERHFTARRMTEEYIAIYKTIIAERSSAARLRFRAENTSVLTPRGNFKLP